MYRVVKEFYDLTDDFYSYLPGDVFPRKGLEVSRERLEYLAGNENRLGEPVINEEPAKKQKKGGSSSARTGPQESE